MSNFLNEISELANFAGQNIFYTQGGGGNISYKNSKHMWIKPSGIRLKDLQSDSKSWVKIDIKKLTNAWENFKHKKICGFNIDKILKETADLLENSIVSNENKSGLSPSVETFMHLLLNKKYVLHNHFLPAIFLSSTSISYELSKTIQKQDSNFKYIQLSYHSPGLPLAFAVENILSNQVEQNIFFLKNHGIIITSDATSDIYLQLAHFRFLFEKITKLTLELSFSYKISYDKTLDLYRFKTNLPQIEISFVSSPITTDYWICFKNNFKIISNKQNLIINQNKGLIFFENQLYFKANNKTYQDYADVLAAQIQLGLWSQQLNCKINFLNQNSVENFAVFSLGKYAI